MKNMALTDLVLVRPRSFPHAEAIALAAGADDILAGARVVDHRRRGDRRLRVHRRHDVAAALVLLGVHDAARCRRTRGRIARREPGGVAVRFRALWSRHRGPESLQCAGAHPRESRILLLESWRWRCSFWPTRCSWRASSRARTPNWNCRWPPSGELEHFYAHLVRGAERNRFRRPHRTSHGALAASVQPRPARSQRTQYPARHIERRAGPARSQRGAPMNAQMPVYLDYAATTPVDPRVAAAMAQCLTLEGEFGNPASSSHAYGDSRRWTWSRRPARRSAPASAPRRPRWYLPRAPLKRTIWRFLAWRTTTSNRGRHIVTARTEHKAVLDPCRELERRGWRVTYLEPDGGGIIHPEQVGAALQADTVLVSIMHVNNEIGVIQDIAAIAAACARHGGARLHVDAAQSVGKCAVDFAALGVDLMSLSAHKVYGPKGVGALLVSRRAAARPAVQLSARCNSAAGRSVDCARERCRLTKWWAWGWHSNSPRRRRWRRRRANRASAASACGAVWRRSAACCATGMRHRSVPHLLNVSFEGVEGESLLAALRGQIAVSTGSACTSALARALLCAARLGPGRHLEREQPAVWLGSLHHERPISTRR